MSAEMKTQGEALQQLGDKVAAALPGAVQKVTVAFGELTLDAEASAGGPRSIHLSARRSGLRFVLIR